MTTRLLQQGIANAGMTTGTVIDIGSGVGSSMFGLLERGITDATAVDASSAYIAVAGEEAARLGLSANVSFIQADFVAAASQIAPSTVVTLDRVVCCYPDCEQLLQMAVRHAALFRALVSAGRMVRPRGDATRERAATVHMESLQDLCAPSRDDGANCSTRLAESPGREIRSWQSSRPA